MTSHPAPSGSAYDRTSVALHWIIALGILILAGLELFRHEFPKGHFIREGLKPIHQPAGVVLMAVIFVRVVWSQLYQRKPMTSGGNPLAAMAAKSVHAALYIAMIALPAAGLMSVLAAGKSVDFGVFALAMPLGEPLRGWAKPLREVHETLAFGLLGLVFVHAAAALFHHYIIRDGVLSRMRFTPGHRQTT